MKSTVTKRILKAFRGKLDSAGLAVARNAWRKLKDETSGIVFSMNRAIQLHALLCSYYQNANRPVPLVVLYRSTSDRHEAAYAEVVAAFRDRAIRFVRQDPGRGFKDQVRELLSRVETRRLFFLVDDIVFTNAFSFDDFSDLVDSGSVFSLRLGENIVMSYNKRRKMAQPMFQGFERNGNAMIRWRWDRDWNYPISLDGHVFLTREIRYMTKLLRFSSPNTYEGALQRFSPVFEQRGGAAYRLSRLVNVPANLVQTDCDNRHGSTDVDSLLEKWEDGFSIDVNPFTALVNESTHQEIPYSFVVRGASSKAAVPDQSGSVGK